VTSERDGGADGHRGSRKVLIVSPRFPPTNAPDMQRIRIALAHLRRFGWEPTILCVDSASAGGPIDPDLAATLPKDVPIVRVRAWSERSCRRFGFGELGYRAVVPLYCAGSALLAHERYDLVFFSTTVFLTFAFGPPWKRRHGCAVVYDFQDPWYTDAPLYGPTTVPGRWWKYRVGRWLARRLERFSLGAADRIVVVSDAYVRDLVRRYPALARDRFTVLPFGGERQDYVVARARGRHGSLLAPEPGAVDWVYAGRAGPDMAPVLRALFDGIAELATGNPAFAARLRLHFIGTNYAPPERAAKLVEPIARAARVDGMVREIAARQPYFDAIAALEASHALLMIGSIHGDYNASKLVPYLLSRKPILALFHRDSLTARLAAPFSNVFLATFERDPGEPAFRARLAEGLEWLRAPPAFDGAEIERLLEPWTAEASARTLCAAFDRAATPRSR